MAKTEDLMENKMTVVSSVSKVRGLDNGGNSVQIEPKTLVNSLTVEPFNSSQRARVASYKELGMSGSDGVSSVMLLFPYLDVQYVQSSLFMGDLYMLRGSEVSGRLSGFSRILVHRAYNSMVLDHNDMGSLSLDKIGICSYNGNKYIAIRFPPVSYFSLTFNGLYTEDCIFTTLPLSSVSWIDSL